MDNGKWVALSLVVAALIVAGALIWTNREDNKQAKCAGLRSEMSEAIDDGEIERDGALAVRLGDLGCH